MIIVIISSGAFIRVVRAVVCPAPSEAQGGEEDPKHPQQHEAEHLIVSGLPSP